MTSPLRRVPVALALAAAAALAGCGGDGPATVGAQPPPTTTSTTGRPASPTTTTTAEPVVEPVALPTPVDVPEDPRADEPDVVLGTIEIPRLGLAVPLHQGISLDTIDRGPSHWPGTALPGDPGNVVVAGHRVTNSRPFRHLEQLVTGDEVVFTVDGRRSAYRVTGSEVVLPDAMHIVDQLPEPTATLFACHPPGSARQRYVVRAALVTTT